MHRIAMLIIPFLAAGLAVAADTPAVSGDAQKVVDYRHAALSSFGKHMKASSAIVKGEVVPTQADLVLHARALKDGAAALPGWFPEGTGPDKTTTEALDTIWSDRPGFEEKAAAFDAAAAELLTKAEANDLEGFKGAFKAVGQSCGGCHDDYRKDDD